MAEVYELQDLARRVRDLRRQTVALRSTIRSARQTERVMVRQGSTTTAISAVITPILAECAGLAATIATQLDALPMTVWAEEVRIGNPVNYKALEIIDDQDGSHSLITFNDEGGSLLPTHLFVVDDVLEIVNPEKGRHAQTVIVDDTTADGDPADADPTSSGFHGLGVIPGSPDAQGIVNTDTSAKLILRER